MVRAAACPARKRAIAAAMPRPASANAIVRYLGVLVFSSVGGLVPGTLFTLAVRVAPDEGTVSTTVGWMQQWSAFGQFAGPPLVAWAAARAGGWHVMWWVTGSCALAGLCIASVMERFLARQSAGRPTSVQRAS